MQDLTLSQADQRTLLLWDRYREQKVRWNELAGGADNPEEEAAWRLLMDIEHVLHADIGASTHAVAASLIIEIEDNESDEDVRGLWRGSLVAIRPQLVGSIAQDVDRALAEKIEEAAR
jgi:hypothetical protein